MNFTPILITGVDCEPCKLIKKELQKERIEVLCMDKSGEWAKEWVIKAHVKSVPTLIVFDKEGEIHKTHVGYYKGIIEDIKESLKEVE